MMESTIEKHTKEKSKCLLPVVMVWCFSTDLFLGTCVCAPIKESHFLHSSVCPAQPLLFTLTPERLVSTDVFALPGQVSAIYTSSFSPPFCHKMYIQHVVFHLAFSLNSLSCHALPIKDIQMCYILSNSCIIFHYRDVSL